MVQTRAAALSPKAATNLDYPPIEITIRATAELAQYAKGWPETLVARYLDRAFDQLNVPYRIVYDLPPVGTDDDTAGGAGFPSETADGLDAVFDAWRTRLNQGDVRVVGKDANLLLTNQRGGGKATVKGWASVGPGRTLDREYDLVEYVTVGDDRDRDDPQRSAYGALHECAHNLGARHDPNWGDAWNDDETETFNRTITAVGGAMTRDGDELPTPAYSTRRNHLRFGKHARDYLAIKPVDFYTDVGLDTLAESAETAGW